MRRLIAVFLICAAFISCSFAEDINIGSLSFDELRQLQTDISKELITRPEWKSVPVPPGFYQVGLDIPAGEWTLTCGKAEYGYANISCGKETNETKTKIRIPWEFGKLIHQEGSGKDGAIEKLNVLLLEGYYIEIEYGEVIFSTPERVNLGF